MRDPIGNDFKRLWNGAWRDFDLGVFFPMRYLPLAIVELFVSVFKVWCDC